MGPALEPITEKDMREGSGNGIDFSKGDMPCWTKRMENAQIHESDIGEGCSLFAVFDGHGGRNISKYLEIHFTGILTGLDTFKKR